MNGDVQSSRRFSTSFVTAVATLCLLTGYGGAQLLSTGQSNKQRKAAQSAFRDNVLLLKIATSQGLNKLDFSKHRLEVTRCYERHKDNLEEFSGQFARLALLMEATSYCWERKMLHSNSAENQPMMELLATGKLKADTFYEGDHFVRKGLNAINSCCAEILAATDH